jgi:hypothetical protein
MNLNTQPNLSDPDNFYAALTNVHRDLDREQSESVNARLILLLANHVGQQVILEQALQIAAEIE